MENFLYSYEEQRHHIKHVEKRNFDGCCSLCQNFIEKQRKKRKMCSTCYEEIKLHPCCQCNDIFCKYCILRCDNHNNWDFYHGRGCCKEKICSSCQNKRKSCISCGNKGCSNYDCYPNNGALRACDICNYANMGRFNDDEKYKLYYKK